MEAKQPQKSWMIYLWNWWFSSVRTLKFMEHQLFFGRWNHPCGGHVPPQPILRPLDDFAEVAGRHLAARTHRTSNAAQCVGHAQLGAGRERFRHHWFVWFIFVLFHHIWSYLLVLVSDGWWMLNDFDVLLLFFGRLFSIVCVRFWWFMGITTTNSTRFIPRMGLDSPPKNCYGFYGKIGESKLFLKM